MSIAQIPIKKTYFLLFFLLDIFHMLPRKVSFFSSFTARDIRLSSKKLQIYSGTGIQQHHPSVNK